MEEPLVAGPSRLEVEIAIAVLKKYKSPGSDEIPAELIQAEGEILLYAIHKLINSVSNKEELPDQWKESVIVPVYKTIIISSLQLLICCPKNVKFRIYETIILPVVLYGCETWSLTLPCRFVHHKSHMT
jgi:hypothetical protein